MRVNSFYFIFSKTTVNIVRVLFMTNLHNNGGNAPFHTLYRLQVKDNIKVYIYPLFKHYNV